MHNTTADTPHCTACPRPLHEEEFGRHACTPCERRTAEHLAALAGPTGLYARLRTALTPGRTGDRGGRVTGSRHAPPPVRLEPLSLTARGGMVTILQTWLVDWHEMLGWTWPRWQGGPQQQLDQVVKQLRNNLPWASASHPAVNEFMWETSSLRRQAERTVTGERPERTVTVACGCGQSMRITLSTPGRRCGGCGEQYGWADLRTLPLAERAAA